jgi:hypothetical protein
VSSPSSLPPYYSLHISSSLKVFALAFVVEAHGAAVVAEGVSVAVDFGFGAIRLLGVFVGGWKVGCAINVGHDGVAVVFCAFEVVFATKSVKRRVNERITTRSLLDGC